MRRLAEVSRALGESADFESSAGSFQASIMNRFAKPVEGSSYLLLAALGGGIPTVREIDEFDRRRRADGDAREVIRLANSAIRRFAGDARPIRISDAVLVDVTDTVKSPFTTGIQRVVRETVPRWSSKGVVTVAWDSGLRKLRGVELGSTTGPRGPVIIPFGGTFVLPEIAVEESRAARIAAIASRARMRTLAIGHDCIPLTTAEVAGPGMPGAFAKYLAAMSQFSTIATTSGASEAEYRGWRKMLAGAGLDGPRIARVGLAFEAGTATEQSAEQARESLGVPPGSMVLAVGSHEPRKNHQRVLAAAEALWDSGLEFSLVMVGGNSWDAEGFLSEVERLRAQGRAIITASRASDEVLWGLYRSATVSIFPSLNEGFGLPIVESIALGTPVITSDFGAMRELGAGKGALLVDPLSVPEMTEAVRSMLEDHAVRSRLVTETSQQQPRSWDDYASELWAAVEAL